MLTWHLIKFVFCRLCEELLYKMMREAGRTPELTHSDGEEGSPVRMEEDVPSSPLRGEGGHILGGHLDLENLEKKLKSGQYHQADQFADDFRLVDKCYFSLVI